MSNSDADFEIEELKEKCSKRIREFQRENANNTFDLNTLKSFVQQKPAKLITIEEFWNDIIKQHIDSKGFVLAETIKNC